MEPGGAAASHGGVSMTEIIIRHVISFDADTCALLVSIADSLARAASPAVAVPPPTPASPVQTEAAGVSRPNLTVGLPPAGAEGPRRAAPVTCGEAAKPPRPFAPTNRGWLTAERNDILVTDWPAGVPVRDIRAKLEKTAGPALPPNDHIATTAANRGLRRPPGFTGTRAQTDYQRGGGDNGGQQMAPPDLKATTAPTGVAAPNPSANAVAYAQRPPVPGQSTGPNPVRMVGIRAAESENKWSHDRDRIIRTDYPRGVPLSEILADLNSLSGPEITRFDAVARAQALGLPRSLRPPEPMNGEARA